MPVRIVMDFEASARENGYPIEVGVAFTWQTGEITGTSRLIRHDPWLDDGFWCARAQKIHNIQKEELYRSGRPPAEICDWLNGMLEGRTAYADHEYDKGWLSQLFHVARKKPLFELHHVVELIERADYVNETCLVDFTSGRNSGAIVHRAEADAVRISRALAACCVMSAEPA